MRRWNKPAMRSYRNGILWDVDPEIDRIDMARDLVDTLESNIDHYLRGKSKTLIVDMKSGETVREFDTAKEKMYLGEAAA